MGVIYSLVARPIIAVMDSEKAHKRAILALRIISFTVFGRMLLRILYKPRNIPVKQIGLSFSNPLGLAAGMDKKAEAMIGWENLGFGFIEIGGVTMLEQEGNPLPRMFRSGRHKALVNRMGFNNPGSEKMAIHLSKARKPNIPVLLNVGKSKTTTLEDAHSDYSTTVQRCERFVDGFVINVSSPNTPNLRDLQTDSDLTRIIESVKLYSNDKPVLVKISPDLDDEQILVIVDTARKLGCAGIIATNTTLSRPDEDGIMLETGGLSGEPLRQRSTEVIRLIADHTDGKWPIIGVGGISNSDDAWEKIINGASLVQIYSAMVFHGGGVIKEIVNGLERKLRQNNIPNLESAVGLLRRED